MTIKKAYTHKQVNDKEADNLNLNLDNLYKYKLESFETNRGTGSDSVLTGAIYQSMITGRTIWSGTGSPTITRTMNLNSKQGTIVFANVHAMNTAVASHVIDVTSTAITIELRTITGAALNFTAVTSACVTVFYQVISSNP